MSVKERFVHMFFVSSWTIITYDICFFCLSDLKDQIPFEAMIAAAMKIQFFPTKVVYAKFCAKLMHNLRAML